MAAGSGLFFVGAGVINGERSESKPDLIIYLLNFQNRFKKFPEAGAVL